ncbi:hypothetical protein AVEN_212648-1 [Araneus ventricosus]|uniref:Uncharacterized protein n=1 Tax=Araneus ventricosus TaxID=182803 RepID=A0A4Y2M8D3_ARAVE|nr:hypothetical protein AVEN_212648-1 [Araneus ventricosus]
MERLRKLRAVVETDGDSDFDNGPEDNLEDNFSNHESFSEHDTESEEDGDSGNEEMITRNDFHQKMTYSGEKQNLGRIFVLVIIILCRAYLEQKGQRKM